MQLVWNTYCKSDSLKCHNCGNTFNVMCEACLNMKPYGVPCECGGIKKERKSSILNLTDSAYTKTKPVTVNKILTKKAPTKNQSEYILVSYFDGYSKVCTEFIGKWQWSSYCMKNGLGFIPWSSAEFTIKRNIKLPTTINRKKNAKGYWEKA